MARLLLIEDEADIATLLERYLKRSGFLVTIVGDGEAGIKAFESSPVDIIVTDGLLPKKTGFEVVAAVRASEKGKTVPIVMITAAFKTSRSRKDALDEGVDAFFTKPFILTDLRDKLVELLARHGKAPGPPQAAVSRPPLAESQSRSAAPAAPPTPATPPPAARPAPRPEPKPEVKSAPPRVPTPVPPRATPLSNEPRRVNAPGDAARVLLDAARSRLSGVARFTDGQSRLEIAFLRGVIVGASDNLREHLLGERLWKGGRLTTEQMRELNTRMAEKGERVAEALLALGFCSADEALAFMDDQVRVRVRRALLWTGEATLIDDEALAHRLAMGSFDIAELVLAFGVEPAQDNEAARFVAEHKAKKLERGPRFDDLLLAMAHVRPQSSLPGVFFTGTPTVAEAARAAGPGEVWGACLVGLCRFSDDGGADPRPLPELLKSESASRRVDTDLANAICTTLLKARGRSLYDAFELPADVSAQVGLERIQRLTASLGPDATAGRSLGPAVAAARELWALLDEARRTFEDPARRQAHDALYAQKPPPRPAAEAQQQAKLEDSFLRGQQALEAGELVLALGCFELALASKPSDPEYQSYHAWTVILTGDTPGGTARLLTTMKAHPQSVRPQFFIALAAARRGDTKKAKSLLEECARKSPHDVEVRKALQALG